MTSTCTQFQNSISVLTAIIIRVFMLAVFLVLEYATPFERHILKEEAWLYSYPPTAAYVPSLWLWIIVITLPTMVFTFIYMIKRNNEDFWQTVLACTLALGTNGIVTDFLKLIVGRPRPDFQHRCFIDGTNDYSRPCNGDPEEIKEGRKSFPSGHSSFVFVSFAYVTFYLAGKLHTFEVSTKRETWKYLLFILPLIFALSIAISRTNDYHHHYEDVFVGSLIGLIIAYGCYRFYYPSLNSVLCHEPHSKTARENKGEVRVTKAVSV